ncbi:hypothetical protein PspLS_08273, partial [Pyricularia sp. CBS 133598]
MRFTTFLASSGLVARACASTSASVDSVTFNTFTSAGTANEGFTIPEDLLEGVYSVNIDESGLAHHTHTGDISEPIGDPKPQPGVIARTSTPNRLPKRY